MAKKISPLKSMTAYGRGAAEFSYGRFTVEMQSLNRRYLEINVTMPRLLIRFEMGIKEQVGKLVKRGAVNVFVYWKKETKSPTAVIPNFALAKGMRNAWEAIARELKIEPKIDLNLLSQEKEILLYEEELEEENLFKEALKESIEDALLQLLEMKEKEGKKLGEDLHGRILALQKILQKIEKKAPKATEKFQKKLKERIEDLFSKLDDNEEKILREIAIFSEKVDITEEIVRFKSHLDQFQGMLENPKETEIGKTLDFLIQELNREINTIGSKSQEKEVSQLVIAAKSELEKMREQVQNIE